MLADDPTDTFLRYSLAMELDKEGNHTASLAKLAELTKDEPPYVPAFFMAGQQLTRIDRVNEARAFLRDGIEAARTQGDAHAAGEMSEFLASLGDMAVLSALTPAASPADIVLADSTAEFSNVQGQDSWLYGYYSGPFTPDNFQQMAEYDVARERWQVDGTHPFPFYWTMLDRQGGHPNGLTTSAGFQPAEHWPVRRYESESAGAVTIAGVVGDIDDRFGGQGLIARIFVDGVEVYTRHLGNAESNVPYEVDAVVSVGSFIDFAVDPKNSNDWADRFLFTAVVTTVPEPWSTVLLAAVGAPIMAGRRCRNYASGS
ncbi:unnamed protein product [Ostreobium quekettii]|uniref:Uncharacterized protein n=1 Tax=Ostreobium quekettii TaxID=121088 RepID=A0A8S1IN62_9CHLO|nr:unnamed protein product [Ostreobium quekettii]